jgi:hypothetical protein
MWTEEAGEEARCLLREIIPWFRIPVSIGLDNGLTFMVEVVQLVGKGLGITWKLHMAYLPPGKVECIKRTLKLQLGKLPGDPPTMGSVTAHSLSQDKV